MAVDALACVRAALHWMATVRCSSIRPSSHKSEATSEVMKQFWS